MNNANPKMRAVVFLRSAQWPFLRLFMVLVIVAGLINALSSAHAAQCPPLLDHRFNRLQDGQAVAVNGGADLRRARIQHGARHPTELAVRVGSRADKLAAQGGDEITAHAPPDEQEIIVVAPDIGSGGGQGIALRFRIIHTGPRDRKGTDIGLVCELPDRAGLG